jgi:phospholipase/carboxylesterase
LSSTAALAALERPAAGEAEGALVLIHGRGASEHDLYPLLDALDPRRRLLGLAPRGPLSLPPGGAHWYGVPRVGFPDPDTFFHSYALAAAWLDALPFPPERIVIGGFSQGAVMSLALGLGGDRPRPAAIVALSGFVPTVTGWEPKLDGRAPVAIGHGIYDEVVPVQFARDARRLLGDDDLLYRESPLPHAIDPRFLGEVRDWLEELLAG